LIGEIQRLKPAIEKLERVLQSGEVRATVSGQSKTDHNSVRYLGQTFRVATMLTPVSQTFLITISPIFTGASNSMPLSLCRQSAIFLLGIALAVFTETIRKLPPRTGTVEVTIRVGFVHSWCPAIIGKVFFGLQQGNKAIDAHFACLTNFTQTGYRVCSTCVASKTHQIPEKQA